MKLAPWYGAWGPAPVSRNAVLLLSRVYNDVQVHGDFHEKFNGLGRWMDADVYGKPVTLWVQDTVPFDVRRRNLMQFPRWAIEPEAPPDKEWTHWNMSQRYEISLSPEPYYWAGARLYGDLTAFEKDVVLLKMFDEMPISR